MQRARRGRWLGLDDLLRPFFGGRGEGGWLGFSLSERDLGRVIFFSGLPRSVGRSSWCGTVTL